MMNVILRLMAWPVAGLFLLGTLGTTALAFSSVGATEMEHPEGLSLRQESASHSGGFFVIYSRRMHLGGGLGGGK